MKKIKVFELFGEDKMSEIQKLRFEMRLLENQIGVLWKHIKNHEELNESRS